MACLQTVPNRAEGVPCVLRMIALSLCKHCKKVITMTEKAFLGCSGSPAGHASRAGAVKR
ncbi:MAG TPA: hypothetical protein VFK46_03480 [Candidatus Macondimonas sp.]|nr:hypothetical protein [Candidatus Macondimonas sp.]